MKEAKRHLTVLGFSVVKDVSKTKPYDLLIAKRHGADKVIVEVKGSTGPALEILLTAGEVIAHGERFPANGLLIVSNIELERTDPPKASGGDIRWLQPWDMRTESLVPIVYRYKV